MTIDEFLNKLDRVRARGTGAWYARCPAHQDGKPSLSVHAGDHGVLLRCFAGCDVSAICSALGLRLADLFYEASLPKNSRPAPLPKNVDRVKLAFRFDLAALDLRLRAARTIDAGKRVTTNDIRDHELDEAIGLMALAHADIARAELFEHVGDTLKTAEFLERQQDEQHRHIA